MHYEPKRSLVIKTAATTRPVSADEAKAQLRAEDFTDDDVLIDRLIKAATAYIDCKGILGAALMAQTWTLKLEQFPSGDCLPEIELPFPPLIAVNSVKYYDVAGTLQTMAPTAYQVDGIGAWRKARILPAPLTWWPLSQSGRVESVQIEFQCGHAAAADMPENIRHALLMLIGHFYENRETVLADPTGRAAAIVIPKAFDDLLAPVRIPL